MICHPSGKFLAKDFIETKEGLAFAVVENGTEQGKVLCFLRYHKTSLGWQKLTTTLANALLKTRALDYLYYSANKDAHLHAIPEAKITNHYSPETVLQSLLYSDSQDLVINDLQQLLLLLQKSGVDLSTAGITGSLLINAQRQDSDIDLVFYDRSEFFQARECIRNLIERKELAALSETDWQESYERRSCDLSFSEYLWHEQRKLNKALINRRKFDLSFVDPQVIEECIQYKKIGSVKIQASVVNDSKGFDYPSIFLIDDPQVQAVVSYTATYTGQAITGERVEISGLLEQASNGQFRIVVGSSREARGEYIKVLH